MAEIRGTTGMLSQAEQGTGGTGRFLVLALSKNGAWQHNLLEK
jgi:hypothetical protein